MLSGQKAIDTKLTKSHKDLGLPLSGNPGSFRKLRRGDFCVVYQVINRKVIVYVLAVGPRKDKEIYRTALKKNSIN
ncbi:MAG: type II toxin-antitoxin system RelE/ParE family toxin [Thermodesulfobacteriota bacterium]|nr:type II toxin-antitoxin system RelE/ParE family toxin [Thermodesulfobacteriota bacterium]